MRQIDREYVLLLNKILTQGEKRPDRTGTGTIQIPYHSMELDISKDFPAMSFKKLAFKTMLTELNWFLLGRNDIEFLHHHGCHIWDGDFEKYQKRTFDYLGFAMDTFGISYGLMWEQQGGFKKWAEDIRKDPFSRRHVVYNGSSENRVRELRTALQPCHDLFEFNIHNGKLNLHFHMRSVDVGLGLPFNIGSYALLLCVMSNLTGYPVGSLYVTLFNVHIYLDHANLLRERINDFISLEADKMFREPVGIDFSISEPQHEFDFILNAKLVNYSHAGDLKLPLST